jgi:hypothetical protein
MHANRPATATTRDARTIDLIERDYTRAIRTELKV